MMSSTHNYTQHPSSTPPSQVFGLWEECPVGVVKLSVHSVGIYVFVVSGVYVALCLPSSPCRESGRRSRAPRDLPLAPIRNLFHHHVSIWICSLILMLGWLTQVSAQLVRFQEGGVDVPQWVWLADGLLGAFATTVSLALYHMIERRRLVFFCTLHALYYTLVSLATLYEWSEGLEKGLSIWIHVKPQVQFVYILTSLTLTLLFTLTIFKEGKCVRGDLDEERIEEGTSNIKYLHHSSSLISRLTFYWFTDLLGVGYRHPLEDTHLGTLPKHETTHHQLQRLEKHLQIEKRKSSDGEFSLWRVMCSTLWSSMALGGIFRLCADFAGFVAPLGIKTIVAFTEGGGGHANGTAPLGDPLTPSQGDEIELGELMRNGYFMALVVLLSSLLQSTFSQCSTFLVNSEGIHMKVALQGLIYKKTLRLYPGGGGDGEEDQVTSHGSIVNIMSEDTNNLMMFFWMAHFIWAIPLKLLILMGLLYLQLGWSALIGAALCILIMIPLQFIIAKQMSSNSKLLMERCDERLRGISQILHAIKLIKVQGWELIFAQRVQETREEELKHLDKDLLYRSFMTFLTHISSVVVTLVTFGLYSYIEEERLEPPKVFAGLALFNQLTVPLFIFPITVPVVIDALVSARRVREFLLVTEASSPLKTHGGNEDEGSPPCANTAPYRPLPLRQPTELDGSTDSVFVLENIAEDDEEEENHLLEGRRDEKGKGGKKWLVRVREASFGWDESPYLKNIRLEIPRESFTVIVGWTGSGKSSLISAILGDLKLLSGQLKWQKDTKIAYAAQKPWMLNASVRENILFGRGFKGGRYKRVIEACALQPDIDILPEGDATEIGHKGINLSGGQKQRIAIARALYSTANLVILDDPLSALDVEVAHHVLDTGIRKLLVRSHRTVILVTHHLPVLHHAHHIIAMEGGEIRIQGTLSDIQRDDPILHAQWHQMITQKEAELQRQLETKTAKERWSLLKLVSKIGLQFRAGGSQGKNKRCEMDEPSITANDPFRKRKGTFSHYKNLSHDIFLPSDECHDEIMTPLLRRRAVSRTSRDSRASGSSAKQHVPLQRMSSLQTESRGGVARPNKSPAFQKKFSRLQSLPAGDEAHRIEGVKPFTATATSASGSTLFKRLFSTNKNTISSTGSSNPELEVLSTCVGGLEVRGHPSAISEGNLTEDEPEEGDELLFEMGDEGSGEEREYGRVPLRVYSTYIRACGGTLSLIYLIFAIGYEVIRVVTNLWLSEWSDTVSQVEEASTYEAVMSYYFRVYVLLSLVTVSVSLTCNLVGKRAGGNSRSILNARMMDTLIRCPITFFESTPIGRIINRCSSDVAVVDRKLCISMQRFVQFVLLCLSAIVVNGMVNPWFLLAALPVLAIYYMIQRFYRFSSREMQRLQAISRGPIYSHFEETLEGLSTIRAFRQEKRFTTQMLSKIDANNRADMFINVGNRWLSISLDYLGSVIVWLATVGAMLSSTLYPDVVTPSIVGLAINYTLLVPVYLNWVVKFLAEVEMFMNSVDRLEAYAHLPMEDYGEGTPPPPPSWPTAGHIQWNGVNVQYGAHRPPIISNLNLQIKSQEKVGICGRSGCGKSSLLMSLFRISEVTKGQILIDGVDIGGVPLLTLRSSLSIIPQENIIFNGTLRFNLDPEGKCRDQDIWNALESSQIKEVVLAIPGQLDGEVSESSFSAGQKQLLALARAILHKSRVVIMDEATSSVDLQTERTLLHVVKEAFKGSTVLTIAHRLETIVDGDRVIVLEGGVVLEDAPPQQLMRKANSHFAQMIRASTNKESPPT